MNKKVMLVILDGWGLGNGTKADAISNANTPFVDSLYKNYPHTTLQTSGENVGLPDGQMGNSEVGHLNIGAGRVVYQDLALINKAIREKTIDTNKTLIDAFEYARKKNRDVHFIGLLSEGGVHSSQLHLHYLCELAKQHEIKNVFIHAFTDGRDTDPKSGIEFISNLENHLQKTTGKLASVMGRYYAMDRDKRWERIAFAYNLLVNGEGKKSSNIKKSIQDSYKNGITDEFIKPIVMTDVSGNPIGTLKEDDIVICFNFRTDRCREITQVLTQQDMLDMQMKKLNLHYVTMTKYDDTFVNVNVMFAKDNLLHTLGEVLADKGKSQLRIAETEKYPHVTFFFSGGREKAFEKENRIMIPSPKVATYDLQPEMSAAELTDALLNKIDKSHPDFICLNYANADMVGHTGNYTAVIKAIETVDTCLKRTVEKSLQQGYSFIIIADHGNADFMINDDGSPNTAHTTNSVPCILIDSEYKKINSGRLADIAPTVLTLMKIEIPIEMTGKSLL